MTKKRDKKKLDKSKRSRSTDKATREEEESADGEEVGPAIPENFYEDLLDKENKEKEEEKIRKDLLTQSYKRPRRQKVIEVMHPSDEKKILA